MKLLISLKDDWYRSIETSLNPNHVFHKPGVFWFFWGGRKWFVRKLCPEEQHPPPLDLIQLLLLGPKKWIYLTFVWIKICICWFSGQSLSSSEGDDIAWKRKPKETQKRKKKEKNNIDSGNVLGWTQTVSKGTDVETLHKLLHLCFCFNGVLCCTVSLSIITETASWLAQLVRALDCCAGGRGFEPQLDQHLRS